MPREADIERRTRRYWYEDGFVEIGMGILFAALGGLFVVGAVATTGALRALAVALSVLLVLLGALALRVAIRVTKERVTYPRTGYVAYRRPVSNSRVLIAVLVVVIGTSVSLAGSAGTPGRILALQTLTLAAALAVPALRFGLRRFYALAIATLAAGCVAASLGLSETGGSALLYGGAGVAIIVSGAWTLRSYIRHTRVAVDRDL